MHTKIPLDLNKMSEMQIWLKSIKKANGICTDEGCINIRDGCCKNIYKTNILLYSIVYFKTLI